MGRDGYIQLQPTFAISLSIDARIRTGRKLATRAYLASSRSRAPMGVPAYLLIQALAIMSERASSSAPVDKLSLVVQLQQLGRG